MKADTHPQWYPEAEVVYDGEVIMTVGATQPRIVVEVWSGTHPFYTGQSRLLDTEGQVDRFMRRLRRREEIQAENETQEQKRDPKVYALEMMELGDRAEKALTTAGITTVGDVYDKIQEGDDALLAIAGVGQRALIDIKRYLRAEGLIE